MFRHLCPRRIGAHGVTLSYRRLGRDRKLLLPLTGETDHREVKWLATVLHLKVEELGFVPQLFIEHLLCASTLQGAGDSWS